MREAGPHGGVSRVADPDPYNCASELDPDHQASDPDHIIPEVRIWNHIIVGITLVLRIPIMAEAWIRIPITDSVQVRILYISSELNPGPFHRQRSPRMCIDFFLTRARTS